MSLLLLEIKEFVVSHFSHVLFFSFFFLKRKPEFH